MLTYQRELQDKNRGNQRVIYASVRLAGALIDHSKNPALDSILNVNHTLGKKGLLKGPKLLPHSYLPISTSLPSKYLHLIHCDRFKS